MNKENLVTKHWKRNENFIKKSFIDSHYDNLVSLTDILSGIFCAGPSYYYVLDFLTREIEYVSPSIKEILGLSPSSVTFNDIVQCVHPDDLNYVEIAEKFNLEKLAELEPQMIAHTKLSYCFREEMANGNYELFQLQAVWINHTGNPKDSKLLNIHTNIQHLTEVNNYILTLSNTKDHSFFLRFNLKKQVQLASQTKLFTQRELEIIGLIAEGLESEQISEKLCLSLHTVRTHRRNILRKAEVNNAAQLIRFCINGGLL